MPKEDYTPGSHKYAETHENEAKSPRKKIAEPVCEKRSISSRFKETFFGESFESVKDYVIWDIMMPALKEFLYNLPQAILGALFYGDTSGRYRTSSERHRPDNYASTRREDYSRYSSRREENDKIRSIRRYDFDRFEFSSRQEAQDVLYEMLGEIDEHGQCSVADFYEMIGKDSQAEWIDQKWVWTDLARVRIVPRRGRYVILLPEPDTYIK
jgi:hypothetical protein